MRNDESLKKRHEKAAAERFINLYNKEFGYDFILKLIRESPDFEYQDTVTGETIGLEVVTVYYNKKDAENSWNMARGISNIVASDIIVNPDHLLPDHLLLEFINKQVRKKAQKNYNYPHPIILVLDTRPALSDEFDINEIVKEVQLPDELPFKEIFLGVSLTYGRSSPHQGQYCIFSLYNRG